MGIKKVETSVCLRYKKEKTTHKKKSSARYAVRCWVYINKCLASAVTELVGFLCSLLQHLIFHQLILFSCWLQQELGCNPRILMQLGSGSFFMDSFRSVEAKKPIFRDISNLGILNDSHPLGSFSEIELELQNKCQSWVPRDGVKEMWGGKVQGWDFRARKEAVHHRLSPLWCLLVLFILGDIKVPQPESVSYRRKKAV